MPKSKLKILMVAAEAAPLAKVGGLADVVGALPQALASLGCEIKIVLPFYGLIDRRRFAVQKIINNVRVESDGRQESVAIYSYRPKVGQLEFLLIDHKFFLGKKIYVGGRLLQGKSYSRTPADVKRFAFFSRAALVAVKTLDWRPDVIHCHDWHTALIPLYLKDAYTRDRFFKNTKTVYTIHNLANQGKIGPEILGFSSLDPNLPVIKADLANGDINFMVQGILAADLITTVSPTYSKEILHHYQGAGLEKILKKRRQSLYGIINGLDTELFDPKNDPNLVAQYDRKALVKKVENKFALQKMVGWPKNKQLALIGMVSRLVWQKGFDLISEKLLELPCQFIILGSGDSKIEKDLFKLTKKYPQKIYFKNSFDLKLAQMIYAGADLFLMPSRFEPCGLSQLIAMRYGTVPVVRKTGGLKDTVNSLIGFNFSEYNEIALHKTLEAALRVYYEQPKKWLKLQNKGMKQNFSWRNSAKKYLKLYNKLIKG